MFVGAVALGPNAAYARRKPDGKFPAFILKMLKSKKLFTDQWWKELKQKYPN